MRILVTGSEGTLGRPLVKELRGRGHAVWGCDREHSADAQFTRASVSELRQLDRAFEEADPEVVYHLAAEFGRHNGEHFYEDLWKTAAIGTRNVLELCRVGQARLLFASSSEVYGDATTFREDWGEHVNPLNEYALSKWCNEQQIMNFQRRHDLEAARLRFFNAYGPGEYYHPYRSVVALFCHKALCRDRLPVYEGYHRVFQYIDDFIPTLANACTASLHHDVYNIGGSDYRSVEDLARIVLKATGQGDDRIELIPEDRHNVRNKRPNIERARQDLGHDPSTRLEVGVPVTLSWMQSLTERSLVADG